MTALRHWLKANKLEAVADALEAADIDLDILPDLTESDLEKLGLSLGNRRRLLKAVAERGTASPPPAPPAPDAAVEAERRQVTVVFCDLVGSTALSGTIDPEHLGDVIRRYQNAAAGAIGRYGGFVAKFMGDGVLAYFGFPQAFEDAAERAVRAALAIVAEIQGIARPDGAPLQTRIGIATGLVVVGELIGAGTTAHERTIVGETPNLAARLQALAAPDQIVIAETTQQLLGGLFELEATGPHALKGIAAPVTAWRVVGEAAVESRFAAIRHADLPMIGRAHEMGMLLERWRLAAAGEGQIVTVTGEAGIGKSRIAQSLQERIAAEPHIRIHLQCSPYHTDSAFYPVIQHLGRAARFAPDDTAETKLVKLAALFPADRMPLAAELMALPATPMPLTPAQRKAATIAMLDDALLQLAETEPLLVVLEDAHWIDATTLDLIARLADSIGAARLLALVTARPEFAPPWQARSHATLLTLNRLGRAECAELVAGVAQAHGLAAETVAAIVAKTDGVPLFAEELTKSVLEATGDESSVVPATLKDSLMARLDRLGEAREVAQIASVIGRQFAFDLLDAVVRKRDALDASLAKLVTAGIVFPEGRGAERGFTFKHALVRDAAYESLLFARRREWHERVARALERDFPEVAANEPELLAYHFGAAGMSAEACDYRERAGDRAVSLSAYQEAIAHFSAGLKEAEALPDAARRMRHQLDLLLKLGPALMVVRGMQSPEAAAVYRRAADIGESLGDSMGSFKAKWGLWLNANISRKTGLARDRARELVALAERSGDGDLLLEAYHCRWSTGFFRGDVAAALADSQVGIATYDMARHRHLGAAFGGHDPGVCAHVVRASVLQLAGRPDQVTEMVARGIALAEALNHPFSIVHALVNSCQAHQMAGDRERVSATTARVAVLAEKFGLMAYRAGNLVMSAWAAATGSGIAGAARLIDAEIGDAASFGPLPQYYLGLAGEVLLLAGRAADGLAHLDRALAGMEEPGVGFYVPEIYRLRGACLLALDRNNKDAARAAFVTAKDVAVRQGATLFARHAEAALAAL